MSRRFWSIAAVLVGTAMLLVSLDLQACTGIRLRGQDGTIVYGRTMEWGSFDLHSRVAIVPRGQQFIGQTPDGKAGLSWKGKYGIVGIDAVKKDVIVDGMNEKGLAAGLFYHPGFAKYADYDPAKADVTMGPTDVAQYVLSQCATIDEARQALGKVRVVGVNEPALGIAPPLHLMVTEPNGKSLVVEFLDGKTVFFDNPIGVITNAPSFDWHMINLRNHINLSALAVPGKKIEDLDFRPLGAGSGLIGLPGDFTPPSRFIRAVAFTQTARPTEGGMETVYEGLRILDNFNVPLEGVKAAKD
jgi:choloylglycine hydrolase